MYLAIGDISGQYKALLDLLSKAPNNLKPLSVGDMVDRGPESSNVISYIKTSGEALLGNHEHMMLDYYNKTGLYLDDVWDYNGGVSTRSSYQGKDHKLKEHLTWLRMLPLHIEYKNYYISHAPFSSECKTLDEKIWNRYFKWELKDKICIFGHNASDEAKIYTSRYPFGLKLSKYKELKEVEDIGEIWAVCLDSSSGKKLTGLDLDTFEFYEQEYV